MKDFIVLIYILCLSGCSLKIGHNSAHSGLSRGHVWVWVVPLPNPICHGHIWVWMVPLLNPISNGGGLI